MKPKRILFLFSFIIRTAAYFARKKEKAVIKKVGRIPKPPYILLSNHSSFMDIYLGLGATSPRRSYWVCAAEEFIDKYFVCVHSGIMPKRRFVNDPRSLISMADVLKKKKKIMVMYPEAVYSFVGKPLRIDEGLGKLVKYMKVPVVFLNCKGSYLRQPQWSDQEVRPVPIVAEMECIIPKSEIEELSAEDIQKTIRNCFSSDEEEYQLQNHIKIDYPNRAEGLERILYQCPRCGKEFHMSSKGDTLSCDECGTEYRLNEDGTLSCVNGEAKFTKISSWFEWEKSNVEKEVRDGTYHFEDNIRMEKMEGVKVGLVPLEGEHHLTHDIDNGIIVKGPSGIVFHREPLQSFGLHIDYNWKGKGGLIDLSSPDETYFAYPLHKEKWLTKIRFAVEAIYDLKKEEIKKIKNLFL